MGKLMHEDNACKDAGLVLDQRRPPPSQRLQHFGPRRWHSEPGVKVTGGHCASVNLFLSNGIGLFDVKGRGLTWLSKASVLL